MSDWPKRFTGEITWQGTAGSGNLGQIGTAQVGAPQTPNRPPMFSDSPPLSGGDPLRLSPEDMVIGGLLACYMQTFLAIVRKHDLPITGFRCTAEATVEPPAEGEVPRITKIDLRPVAILTPTADDKAKKRITTYLEKGEKYCYIAQSLTAEKTVTVTLESAAPTA